MDHRVSNHSSLVLFHFQWTVCDTVGFLDVACPAVQRFDPIEFNSGSVNFKFNSRSKIKFEDPSSTVQGSKFQVEVEDDYRFQSFGISLFVQFN